MNRAVTILSQLESSDSTTREELARRCGVGVRTIASEIAHLNKALEGAASIRLADGRYRLLIVDAGAYGRGRERLATVRESFNDPQWRAAWILARLLRSEVPVRTEDLALEMRLGRTSVVADVADVRTLLAPFGVTIEGRTRVGLQLAGPEAGIRLAVLDHAYAAAYRDYPLGDDLQAAVEEVLTAHRLGSESRAHMLRWVTVVLDRHLTGHDLGALPATYHDLLDTPAHDLARALAARLEPLLGERLPDEEVLFLALPAAGLRMVVDDGPTGVWPTAAAAGELVGRILERITDEMDVRLAPSELTQEFSQHLTFLLNRMRFGLRLAPDTQGGRLRDEYPAASRMATIAGDVIERETGLAVEAGELSLLTTYFQVFLAEHASKGSRDLVVTIVSGRGPATARLVRANLESVLPAGTRHSIVPDAPPGDLDDSDLVVTTPGTRAATRRPTLELGEVFDRQAVLRRLHALRVPTHGPLSHGASAGSFLAALLDEGRFVRLPAGCDYREGTQRLVARLTERGLVGAEFAAAIAAREDRATMQLDDQIGFPHATDPTIASPVCALGVVPRSDGEAGVRVIVCLAVPAKLAYDDTLLIRVYDEVIRLGANRPALAKLSRLTSYEQFFYFMENLATGPTT